MDTRSSEETTQLCWTCRKACGGCSWSERGADGKVKFEPVPGWNAVPTRRSRDGKTVMESYCIKACPEYEPDPPRMRRTMAEYGRVRGLTKAGFTLRQIALLLDTTMADVRQVQNELRRDERGGS